MLCLAANHLVPHTLKWIFIVSVFLYVLTSVKVKATCPANKEIVCPCGGKRNVTLCNSGKADPCEKLKFCRTCSSESTSCLTCPPGSFGQYCEKGYTNRWNNISNGIEEIFPEVKQLRDKRAVSCRDLPSPKLGSIRCWFSRNEKECTGRCLPGHSFQNREVEEIVLKCIRGRWEPTSSFPSCVSEGHCDLEMTGPGNYNCTTGSKGTYCDVRCTSGNRWLYNRHFCYPGRPWDPPLPYCIRAKGIPKERVDCKCQNGGTCDVHTETCKCSEQFEGRFCERHVYATKVFCPDPGNVANGQRINSGGRVPTTNGLYEEGSSVAYSCRASFALVGNSLLTCQSQGTWSSKLPICQKIRVPTTTTTVEPSVKIFCPDPGNIANGQRTNSGGRAPTRSGLYEEGSSVAYSCRASYALVGNSLLTCQSQGTWSSKLPICQKIRVPTTTTTTTVKPRVKTCPDPGFIANGDRWSSGGQASSRGDVFPVGKSVVYSCRDGYALQGLSIITCLQSLQWSNILPECKSIGRPPTTPTDEDYSDSIAYCEDPGSDPNAGRTENPWLDAKRGSATNNKEEFPQGFRLQYKCKKGYVLEGDSTILCLFTGVWSADIPTCKSRPHSSGDLIYCPDPGDVENGKRVVILSLNERKKAEFRAEEADAEYPEGVKIKYSCYEGFRLEGDDIIRCLSNGDWSELPPDCIANK